MSDTSLHSLRNAIAPAQLDLAGNTEIRFNSYQRRDASSIRYKMSNASFVRVLIICFMAMFEQPVSTI